MWKTAVAPAEVPVMFDLQGKGSNVFVSVNSGAFLTEAIRQAFPYEPPAVPNAVYVGYSLSPMEDDPPEEALTEAADAVNRSTVQAPTTVSYSSKTKAPGTYTVTVRAKGRCYTGTVRKTYTVGKQEITADNLTLDWTETVYNGSIQHPAVTVKNAAGRYYTGSVTKTFTIQ